MSASALYYTSWENAISPGGFDIYAKTHDISDFDAMKIVRLTKYVPQKDLPSSPTKEEIITKFPQKFTFFRLDSGKYCVACSTYTGKDCYDRFGNYFTHALVLDSLDSVTPADLIGSEEFKRSLTKEEAQSTYPDEPKRVNERDFARPLLKEELLAFFDEERIHVLKKLASALSGATQKRVGVMLCEKNSDVKYWLTALTYVLPESIWKNISFSTYGGDRSFMIVAGADTSPYVNSIDIKSYTFEMACAAADLQIAFEPLVERACDLFASDPFSAQMLSKRAQELSNLCDTADLGVIFRLWCVENNKFDAFLTPGELKRVLEKYYKAMPEKAQRVTKNVVFALSFSLSYEKNFEYTELLRFLFANASVEDKNEILTFYIDQSLEKSAGVEPHKLYESIKSSCVCPWGEAISMLFEPKMLDHIKTFDTKGAGYFICAIMIDAYSSADDTHQRSIIEYLAHTCAEHASQNDIPLAALILRRASHKGSGLDQLVNTRVCELDVPALSNDPHRTFEYIEVTDTVGECFWSLIINCARSAPESIDVLIPAYINYLRAHSERKAGLETIGSSKEVCRVFLKAVSLYQFEHRGSYDCDLLVAKYDEYMCEENEAISEKAKLIYLETLSSYLEAIDGAARITTCVSILKRIFAKQLPKSTDVRILRLMNHAMFNSSRLSVIKEVTTGDFLGNFDVFLQNAGLEIAPVAKAIIEGDTFVMAANERSNYALALKNIAIMAKDRSFTFVNGKLDAEQIKDFGDIYLPHVIECSRLFANIDENLFQSFMEEILSYLSGYDKFIVTFDQYLDKDLERSMKMLEYTFDYIFKIPNTPISLTVQDICHRYLERLSGSKRKKVLAYLCENAHSRTKMQKYSAKFLETHKTFGAKKAIFAKKRKKKRVINQSSYNLADCCSAVCELRKRRVSLTRNYSSA